MGTYKVMVTIENRPGISDPEGETILKDLVLTEGNSPVTEIRCSKGAALHHIGGGPRGGR